MGHDPQSNPVSGEQQKTPSFNVPPQAETRKASAFDCPNPGAERAEALSSPMIRTAKVSNQTGLSTFS
jgi:hypothetical protein